MNTLELPTNIDIAIIGGGPHALTLATHLLQKRKTMRGRFWVFDPSGTWMSRWNEQFSALEIPHLRSPAVHHPDPNPHGLRGFAENRSPELFPPYDLPGTQLFRDFCENVVQRWQLQNQIISAKVMRLEPPKPSINRRFHLHLENGKVITARRVVSAMGNHVSQLPEWVKQIPPNYPPERLCHSSQVKLPGLNLAGERILIIGGGLTSGHLAVGAIAGHAKVSLMSRRCLYEKLFDADPGWLGPKYLKGFFAEKSWEQRWYLIQQARNGGSLTPAIMTYLRRVSHEGKLTFHEQCQVTAAQWQGENWQVHCDDGTTQEFDRIWLATGNTLNVTTNPLLAEVLEHYPVPIVKGLPVLNSCLSWQGCELFLMGGLAALQVGPTARNLSGARMACDRIVPALTKASVSLNLPA
ncbi:FAD/NAD(P)-binding protein [Floridanema evergladense]|uniref:FAD/NAD(P)-binding protein n=1 Tax=Floridaenema evergladense BLCC-F167 TaxID=3153639 RepID=A0ABV4WVI8_9CYAN